MKKINLLSFLLVFGLVFIVSCDKDDPEIPNEEEVITTLTYTLTPVTGGAAVELKFQDLDGDGGNDPVITVGKLAANTTYSGTLDLLNEQESPTESITEEIEEEAEEHQFFFQTTVSGLTISYNDQDADGQPLGLSTTVSTGDAGNGALTVILRHEPDKSASGVADGNVANAGGETDIEVNFDLEVE